jgi:hypothetical protein
MKHFLFKLLLFISFSGIFTQHFIGQTLNHEIAGSVAKDRCGHVSMPNSSTIAIVTSILYGARKIKEYQNKK